MHQDRFQLPALVWRQVRFSRELLHLLRPPLLQRHRALADTEPVREM